MEIAAHERTGIDGGTLLGNSCEGLTDMFRRGFGISAHLRITKDEGVVAACDADLSTVSRGTSTRNISDMGFEEVTDTAWRGHHLASLNEILIAAYRSLWFNSHNGRDDLLNVTVILHIDNTIKKTDEWDAILERVSGMYPAKTVICAPENAARYLRGKNKTIGLCCPLSLLVASTADEVGKLRHIYSWVWVEDGATDNSTFATLRKNGFRIVLASQTNDDEIQLERLIDALPDLLCTTEPQKAREILARRNKARPWQNTLKKILACLHPRTIKHGLIGIRHKAFRRVLAAVEKRTGKFITFHTRPMYSKDITYTADTLVHTPSCAIVIQGPILKQCDFTLETIRIYKKVYRGVTIILSTWEDEDEGYLKKVRDESIEVVLNKKPAFGGPANLNFQITSARNGIMRAEELGLSYVIKSRTDQRMYNKNIVESLCNLVEYFPPSERSGQKKRIVFIHNMRKYQPYYFTDTFSFGSVDDMLQYWSPDLIEKGAEYPFFVPEVYLATAFLERKGWPIVWSIRAAWEIYRECIITIDWSEVDLFWFKYDYFWEHRDYRYARYMPSPDFLRFHEWFNIFSNMENKVITPEQNVFFRSFPPKNPAP